MVGLGDRVFSPVLGGSSAPERPAWLCPPGRSPERNPCASPPKDNGQRNVDKRHQVLHNALPPVMDCGRRSLALSSGPVCPALTTLWIATAGGVRLTDELHRPRTPLVYSRRAGVSAQGQRCSPTEPGWPGTSRFAGHGPAPWPGPHPESRGSVARVLRPGALAPDLGLSTRMRLITPASPPSREAGHGRSRLLFAGCAARAPTVRRTARRLPHEPSASGPPQPPGGRRIPGPRARTPHAAVGAHGQRRRPSDPDPRWGYPSAAGPTRTRRRPGPR